MLDKLDYRKKQILLAAFALLLLYIAYQFSFKNAFEAIALNRQLKKEGVATEGQSVSYPQIERKNEFYKSVIKGYKVRKDDRENQLWQSLSGMSIANQVQISFVAEKAVLADTSAVAKGVVTDQFTFKGRYANLVKLLDTISKSKGIGKIYNLKLQQGKTNQQQEKSDKLMLVMGLKGIVH